MCILIRAELSSMQTIQTLFAETLKWSKVILPLLNIFFPLRISCAFIYETLAADRCLEDCCARPCDTQTSQTLPRLKEFLDLILAPIPESFRVTITSFSDRLRGDMQVLSQRMHSAPRHYPLASIVDCQARRKSLKHLGVCAIFRRVRNESVDDGSEQESTITI